MIPEVHLITGPIRLPEWRPPFNTEDGAQVIFTGHIRGSENDQPITAIEYEVYESMAQNEIRRLCTEIQKEWPVSRAVIVHRRDSVPVGEAAVLILVQAPRRRTAFRFAEIFLDRLKEEVPIWKSRIIPAAKARHAEPH
jgi:molybdopterin synthase catalytic subunit